MSGDSKNLRLAPYNFEPDFTEEKIKELRIYKMSECSNGGRDLQLGAGISVTGVRELLLPELLIGSGMTKLLDFPFFFIYAVKNLTGWYDF